MEHLWNLLSYLDFDRLVRKGYPIHLSLAKGRPWIEIDFPEELERARKEIFPRLEKKYGKNK